MTWEKLIAEMNGPLDAALLPIGDNYTMGPDDAVRAVKLIEPKKVTPIAISTTSSMATTHEFIPSRSCHTAPNPSQD